MPGVSMAGFRSRGVAAIDMQVIPYPAVTLFIDFGAALLVDDGRGERRHGGGVVLGMEPGRIRGCGRDIEVLQVRLSPATARAVLGGLGGGGAEARRADWAGGVARAGRLDWAGGVAGAGRADWAGVAGAGRADRAEGGARAGAAAGVEGSVGVVALEEFWGRDAGRVRERLRAAGSWEERFAVMEAVLAGRYEAARSLDPEVSYVWERMVASGGQVRVDGLADAVGWSRKRLWSRFRAQVGLTPKRAATLIRFDNVAHRLAAGEAPARVAADHGFTDQSHLCRDVMAFTGLTPTALATAPWLAVDDVAWPAAG
ncbi:helix-turn-helix domain-containing protein [Dactylosporangium vinaceum]|uniref:Helix-turn-helix domain-containing protein n=1 Tax=Dactylosporangium vinaceum TaxID=53362 RepID=A0ABV5M7D0_9ACTN|nr:helix-turn-helix domain-containing protein [Dactylosporangium vinaceum]